MPLYVLYADQPHYRNPTARNAVLVSAADVAAARTAAAAGAPDGETKNFANWVALEIAAVAGPSFPLGGLLWLRGDVVEPLLPSPGR